ncbi:hypothetical protein NUW54_g4876 [Trametes sanguinea]|uniref:Uncharacterized protein n=1 Tax=Trametes sanguinea TaxID=158606 RepID=A0ACC1Q055_9APHY|nr:hypothetical protein NUW54_g4876 [Trametes sanguinea]
MGKRSRCQDPPPDGDVRPKWLYSIRYGEIMSANNGACQTAFVHIAGLPNLELFTTTADHYGPAEILFGEFRERWPEPQDIFGATKWCVFKRIAPTRALVEAAFHWQNYDDHGYIDALRHLQDLQHEGKISLIGLCNFDSLRMEEICEELGPGGIVSNQVQVRAASCGKSPVAESLTRVWKFSLVDIRPLYAMADVCKKHNVKLLTYGTVCGGFLSDTWLGRDEPDLYSGVLTPSQRKYLDMIVRAWGSWSLFQSLLLVLRSIADKYEGMSIANIATRWVLDHPFVGAVIIGARMGVSEHTDDNRKVYGFRLSAEDRAAIDGVLTKSNGARLSLRDFGAPTVTVEYTFSIHLYTYPPATWGPRHRPQNSEYSERTRVLSDTRELRRRFAELLCVAPDALKNVLSRLRTREIAWSAWLRAATRVRAAVKHSNDIDALVARRETRLLRHPLRSLLLYSLLFFSSSFVEMEFLNISPTSEQSPPLPPSETHEPDPTNASGSGSEATEPTPAPVTINMDHPGDATISAAFQPSLRIDDILPDLTLISSNNVYFYVHRHRVTGASTNGFNGLLFDWGAHRHGFLPSINLPESGDVLNVVLHPPSTR